MAGKTKIAVALSGGLDSSFCAWLLLEKGYEVCALTLKIPFAGKDVEDRSESFCKKLGIRHYYLDVVKDFTEHVIKYFVDSYTQGLTPNPCCLCNSRIKFRMLTRQMKQYGCSLLATGHYARIMTCHGRPYLSIAQDEKKSQEYFLSLVPQDCLAMSLFPLGDYTKQEVRALMDKQGFSSLTSRESQDICFIKNKTYKEFLEAHLPSSYRRKGVIRHENGTVLGEHDGIHNFTYGQRTGLGVSWHSPLYVLHIDPVAGEVMVGSKTSVYRKTFIVRDLNWFFPQRSYQSIGVRVRYNAPIIACDIEVIDDMCLRCLLHDARELPCPGQIAVFYEGNNVIAGGVIAPER